VALGHIHKHQSLNAQGSHPPIIYPGSIERIDFGEAKERKGYVLAQVGRGQTEWEFVPLETRRFIDLKLETRHQDSFMADIEQQLPPASLVKDAICRLQLRYPRDWEPLLDERLILDHFEEAFSIQLQKHRLDEKRARLGDTAAVETMTPLELLEIYWQSTELDAAETAVMQALAREVIGEQ
jgi:DNA repair protein SbcD/Mre11